MDYAEEQEMEFEVRTCERACVWGEQKCWGGGATILSPLAARPERIIALQIVPEQEITN